MKGIVTDYKEDKGFGFIKDENEEKRFFHITGVREKDKFLNNLPDYYYTDWVERNCYVVNFDPDENRKGVNAKNISLTQQIFNDKSQKKPFEVLITDLEYYSETLTRSVSGIKGGGFIPSGPTRGGNGTYRVGYPESFKELNIYFRRLDDIGWGAIDVRDITLNINGRSKITSRLVEDLRNKLLGKIVSITPASASWVLNDKSLLAL